MHLGRTLALVSENLPEPSPELIADVESAFDVFDFNKYAEVRITVRLPAEAMPNGLMQKFSRIELIPREQINVRDPMTTVPKEIERLGRMLALALYRP